MSTNPNFNPQSGSSVVAGGYAQPAPGVTEALVTIGDPTGNALATSLAASGVANLQTANYRDSAVTVQISTVAAAPAAAAVVATITPGTAGLWEISGTLTITGTTVAAADTNNMALYQAAVAKINPLQVVVPSTTGSTQSWPIPTVVLNLSASDTVNVKALAAATASSAYGATLVARRVG